MLAQLPAFLPWLAALTMVYVFMWFSVWSADDGLDAHESGLALVASRNPFREQGPPANMAKLILLRHKIQTSTKRRRSPSQIRQPHRACHLSQPIVPRQPSPWVRFPKAAFGGKQYH